MSTDPSGGHGRVLVVDVGGTNVKMYVAGEAEPRKFPSGPGFTPRQLQEGIRLLLGDAQYDVVTLGVPGPVAHGRIIDRPINLGPGWVEFDPGELFQRPVRIINDAALQAVGSHQGGKMLFLGLGTGLGTAMVADHTVLPLEMGHLPYRKGHTFEEYVGTAGMERLGKKKWTKVVFDVVRRFQNALLPDYVVLGGGNAKKLDELPPGCQRGANVMAFVGGCRLWEEEWSHVAPVRDVPVAV